MKNTINHIIDKKGRIIYPRRRMAFGGFSQGAAGSLPSAISTGLAIGGPWGAAAGLGIGLISGLVGSSQEDQMREQERKARLEQERIRQELENQRKAQLKEIELNSDKAEYKSFSPQGYNYTGLYKMGGKLKKNKVAIDKTNYVKPIPPKVKLAKDGMNVLALETAEEYFNNPNNNLIIVPEKKMKSLRASTKLAMGGKLPGGGYSQLSSDAIKIQGDTHNMDTDNDGLSGVDYNGNEVERGEVIYKTNDGEELVFSKQLGFANMVEPLLKQKGKFEKGLQSTDNIKRNTAIRNVEKIDNNVMEIFNQQEMFKNQPREAFKCGGKIRPKMGDGGKTATIYGGNYNRPSYIPFTGFQNISPHDYYILHRKQFRNQPILDRPHNPVNLFTLDQNNIPIDNKPEFINPLYNQYNSVVSPTYMKNTEGLEFGLADSISPYGNSTTMKEINKNQYINPESNINTPQINNPSTISKPIVTNPSLNKGSTLQKQSNTGLSRNDIYNEVVNNRKINDISNNLNQRVVKGNNIQVKTTSDFPNNIPLKQSNIDNMNFATKGSNSNNIFKNSNALVTGAQAILPLANYFINRNNINKIPKSLPAPPPAPANIPTTNINTNVDVSSQLNQIDETVNALNRDIDQNTSDSNTAIARKIALRINAIGQKNQVFNTKTNLENQLKNENIQNAQRVAAINTQNANEYQNVLYQHRLGQFGHDVDRVGALSNLNNSLFQSAQNILTNIQKGQYQDEQLQILGEQFGIDINGKTPEQIRKAIQAQLKTLLNPA